MYWFVFIGLIIFIISLMANIVFLFQFTWKSEQSVARKVAQNVAMSVFAVLFTLMLLELFFNLVFAQSDAFNQTLAGQNWFDRYWRENSLGYRDQEWTPEMLTGRTKVMVLGDSFVAGHGVNNPEDRFSDVLGQLLGNEYAVMNVGRLGSETKEQFEMIRNYPYQPDILVLSFYINDIADTYTSVRDSQPNFVTHSPPLVDDSYAVNFFYWRIYRLGPQEWSNNYWDWLRGIYDDPEVWAAYQEVLLEFETYTRERDAELIVVVFPNLLAIEDSQPITTKVKREFEQMGVPVVDVSTLVVGQEPRDLIVNGVDWHPNEAVHRLVAEALYEIIRNN